MNILQKKKYCQAKLTYSPLGKAFRKQKKIEEQGKKKHMLLQNKTKDWSKDDDKVISKEILDNLDKEKFD